MKNMVLKAKDMNVAELKEQLQSKDANKSWLKNQYPANPSERYSKLTYNNFQNIEDCFGKEASDQLRAFLVRNPTNAVVVAELTEKGNAKKKPRLFTDLGSGYCHEASYYGQYELFASSAHMDGFVEVFQNVKNGSD